MSDGARNHVVSYPIPNAQWSRSIAFGSLFDSEDVKWSSRKRSGLKTDLLRDVPFSALYKIKKGEIGAYGSGYLSSL